MKPEDVRKIAALARLRLAPEEEARFAEQFTAILGHLEKLRAVDTTGVEPLDHPLPLTDVLRDDVPVRGLTPAEVLQGAPDVSDGMFRVPRVLADDEG